MRLKSRQVESGVLFAALSTMKECLVRTKDDGTVCPPRVSMLGEKKKGLHMSKSLPSFARHLELHRFRSALETSDKRRLL
jgi:hypothetical protein